MDQYFNQMEKIIKEKKTSSRIRFMLQDVLDLRQVCLLPPPQLLLQVPTPSPQDNCCVPFVPRAIGCHAEGIRAPRLLIRSTRRLRWKSTENISKCSSSWPRAATSVGVALQARPSVSEARAKEETGRLLEGMRVSCFPLMTSVSATCLGH